VLTPGFQNPPHKRGHFADITRANLLAWYGKTKPNTTKAHSPIKRNILTRTQKN